MVLDPPRQQVNVRRMIIYYFIPILGAYAAWRIQKFWVLLGINFGLNILFNIVTGGIAGASEVSDWEYSPYIALVGIIAAIAIQVVIAIMIVSRFAQQYNEKIAASSTPESSNLAPL